jgi:predicted transposase YbfD/YdcC
MINSSLCVHLLEIPDRRTGNAIKHRLVDILFLTICAAICGAKAWTDIEDFGRAKEEWLRKHILLPNGIPSHDTFRRVFELMDPKYFRDCFTGWVRQINIVLNIDTDVIAIDGKTLRGSKGKNAQVHMVNAWSTATSMVLAQAKSIGKKNEIETVPEVLDLLCLNDCIVTIDAMGMQKKITEKIIQDGGDYAICLKKIKEIFMTIVRVSLRIKPYPHWNL